MTLNEMLELNKIVDATNTVLDAQMTNSREQMVAYKNKVKESLINTVEELFPEVIVNMMVKNKSKFSNSYERYYVAVVELGDKFICVDGDFDEKPRISYGYINRNEDKRFDVRNVSFVKNQYGKYAFHVRGDNNALRDYYFKSNNESELERYMTQLEMFKEMEQALKDNIADIYQQIADGQKALVDEKLKKASSISTSASKAVEKPKGTIKVKKVHVTFVTEEMEV